IKPKSIILKGVNGGFSADMVLTERNSMKLENVKIEKVTEIIFNKINEVKKTTFLIQVSHNSELRELTKIDLLLHQVVKWENLRREKIFQCKKCQRLGHASTNCKLAYRCVKCSGSHGPSACPIKSSDPKSSLKCANCGENGHPANYRGCIYYKHALGLLRNNN
ncbi:GSCOCG00011224001-RA-CDS, partial [Cotesia congregata]